MTRIALSAALAAVIAAGAAGAQTFPERPVTVVVPFGAGAVTDTLARQIAGALQDIWGQPVVVENRPGGGSMVGTAQVAQADPDGYTLLVTTSAFATAPAVIANIPFNPREDLQPIALAGYIPMVFVAGPSTQGATLVEFLDEARARPMFAATAGLGTTTHFTVEMVMQAADVTMDTVHFGGGGEAVVAVMGGHADIYASTPASTLDNIRAGNLRALGIAGASRIRVLPDVPSTAEQGLDGVNSTFWLGVFAPGGIPADLAQAINEATVAALETDSVRERLLNLDFLPQPSSVADFEAQIDRELTYWAELARARGLGR